MTTLDRDECARLLAMRDKATPGPWQAWASDGMMHITGHNAVEFDDGYNAVFAASAHNLANQLEAALAQIDRLRDLLKRTRVPLGKDDTTMLQPCPHCDKPIEVGIDQRAKKSAFFDGPNTAEDETHA